MGAKYYSFKIDGSKGKMLKDGSYPIALVVRKDGRRKKVYLPMSASIVETKKKDGTIEVKSQWNEKFQRFEVDGRKNLHPDRQILNKWLNEKEKLCDQIIKDFEEKRIDWTLNQFKDVFANSKKKVTVQSYFESHIQKLGKSGKIGNMVCYQRALDTLKLFKPGFGKLVFSEIDLKFVNDFNDFLQIERKCTGNTAKYYLKTLRSLMNKAIKTGDCSAITYPFGKNGFSIAGLEQETDKRYLPNEYIERLKIAILPTHKLEYTRNLFLFSYYCQGMSYVDMANLTDKNILILEGGKYLVYKRQKTEGKRAKPIMIKISANIQDLLNWFMAECKPVDSHLLPIVSRKGFGGKQYYEHVRNRYRRYNKYLKELGTALKFEGIKLSSYMSRHSYAMRLKNAGIPEDVISEALGHKDLSTTKVYLGSFEKEVISLANEVL